MRAEGWYASVKQWRAGRKLPHNPDAFGCVKWIGDQRGGHLDDVCPTCGPWRPTSADQAR